MTQLKSKKFRFRNYLDKLYEKYKYQLIFLGLIFIDHCNLTRTKHDNNMIIFRLGYIELQIKLL